MFKFIEKQFRKPSGLLGRFIVKHMRQMNHPIYDRLIDSLDIQKYDKIFEIGYGHGIGIDKILTKNDCYVSGIDFSKLMFEQASKLNRLYIEQSTANLYLGDFLKYPFAANSFDKILCLNVVYFWDDLEIPFKKIYNGLKENGILAIYMESAEDLAKQKLKNKDVFNKYSIDEVVEKLSNTGFVSIDYSNEQGYYLKGIKKK